MPETNQASEEARQGADSDAGEPSGQGKRDGQWVPYERFAEATGRLKQRIDDLSAQLRDLPKGANGSTGQPKTWTRAELQTEVSAGKVTAQQAAEIWDQQLEKRAATTAADVFDQKSQEVTMRSSVRAYEAAVPELANSDSPQFRKLQSERRHLVQELGLPDTPSTMLAALRASFGPVETLRSVTLKEPEPFSETGGGGGGGENVSGDKGLAGLKLTPEQKAHYEKQMRAGQYRGGWADVKKELEGYSPQNKRTREFWRK